MNKSLIPQTDMIRNNVKREIARNVVLKDENILVDAESGEIILQGNVDSNDKKWLAQDIAEDVFGVLHVKNEINVSRSEEDQREDFYEN